MQLGVKKQSPYTAGRPKIWVLMKRDRNPKSATGTAGRESQLFFLYIVWNWRHRFRLHEATPKFHCLGARTRWTTSKNLREAFVKVLNRIWLWVSYNKIPIYPIFYLLKGNILWAQVYPMQQLEASGSAGHKHGLNHECPGYRGP